jgi:hypothetical protein
MELFREIAPVRTCVKTYKNYRSYKLFLISDFNERCGYCHSSHTWYGGYRSFHVDHFAPKDKFAHLETAYSNLVYTCPFCNIAKSNKWPSLDATKSVVNDEGFLDPCNVDYNIHFHRSGDGYISGITATGKYIVKTLFLNLERHAVTWQLSRLQNLINKYHTLLSNNVNEEKRGKAELAHYALLKIFYDYIVKFETINK